MALVQRSHERLNQAIEYEQFEVCVDAYVKQSHFVEVYEDMGIRM